MKLECPTCKIRMEQSDGGFHCHQCGNTVKLEKSTYQHVKDLLEKLQNSFGMLPLKEVRRKIMDDKDPLTLGIIGILAFMLARHLPMKLIIAIIMTLVTWMGPWGALLAGSIPVVWKLHKAKIKAEARRKREEMGDTDFSDLDDDDI